MAYSTTLEQLIEQALDEIAEPDVELISKKMFGGIGYLLNGNMCFGIYKEFLVLRIDKGKAFALLKEPGFRPFDITGKPMKGWVMADPDIYENRNRLHQVLRESIHFASDLPVKTKKR